MYLNETFNALKMDKIVDAQPANFETVINEGKYSKKLIASLKAIDRDSGDSGRIEYFLIGSSLLEISRLKVKFI